MASPAHPEQLGFTAAMGKERVDYCKAKYLIYGGEEERPLTPQKRGTRKGTGELKEHAPFATAESDDLDEKYPADFHKKAAAKTFAGKVGASADFDPQVYRDQINANNQLKETLRTRAKGAGNILSYNGDS